MPRHLYQIDVSKSAKLLLAYLWSFAGRETFVWPSRETISADLNIESARTLRRLLAELQEVRAIEPDVEFRGGGRRSGWWLCAAVGEQGRRRPNSQPHAGGGPTSDGAQTSLPLRAAEPECVDERPKVAGAAATFGRAGTKMAAHSAKNDRSTSIEEKIKISLNSGQLPEERQSELDRLRLWRGEGGDPGDLGPWPRPRTPDGLELPTLALTERVARLLDEERTAEQIHEAVHLIAELVEAGRLAPDKWRPAYVFSGWMDDLVIQALRRRQRLAEKPARVDGPKPEVSGEAPSAEAMAAVLEGSSSLRALAGRVRGESPDSASNGRASVSLGREARGPPDGPQPPPP